eukprot:14870778-Ditylum_brightwellii.AAC.1
MTTVSTKHIRHTNMLLYHLIRRYFKFNLTLSISPVPEMLRQLPPLFINYNKNENVPPACV